MNKVGNSPTLKSVSSPPHLKLTTVIKATFRFHSQLALPDVEIAVVSLPQATKP